MLKIIRDVKMDLYSYTTNWIAYLIQNSKSKAETELVRMGKQSTGNNKFFTDNISKLFRSYAISNESNTSNIIGRCNSSIENKILKICDELQSIDSIKYLNTDCLKSLITDRFSTIESMFINI
jgi:hypothetical protein